MIRLGTDLSKAGKRVAIIVNEVGEVGVDGAVIDSFGLKTVEITEGCICCSLSGSLQNTLRMVTKEYTPDSDHHRTDRTCLRIEDKTDHPNIDDRDEGVITICMIDAFRAKKMFGEAELFLTRQVPGSDIIAINKIDLVDDQVKEDVASIIQGISPSSKIAFISAKEGIGMDELVKMVISEVR